MKIEDLGSGHVSVTMSADERHIITNSLAYLCYAQRPPGLQTIAGRPFSEIENLLATLLSMEPDPKDNWPRATTGRALAHPVDWPCFRTPTNFSPCAPTARP